MLSFVAHSGGSSFGARLGSHPSGGNHSRGGNRPRRSPAVRLAPGETFFKTIRLAIREFQDLASFLEMAHASKVATIPEAATAPEEAPQSTIPRNRCFEKCVLQAIH